MIKPLIAISMCQVGVCRLLVSVRTAIVALLIAGFPIAIVAQSTPGYIYTVANTGQPGSMTRDPSGNLYWCDAQNNQVYKISSSGTVSLFAGTGTASSTGDGGPATSASINGPSAIASDAAGNIYIADFYGNKVRVVNANGIISTFAGSGSNISGGDGGQAINAGFGDIEGVSAYSGNVYISENDTEVIRMINSQGIISTIVGAPRSCGYTGDGGPARNATICSPQGIDFDASGNMYFSSEVQSGSTNSVIRKVDTAGNISTYATPAAGLGLIHDIKFDANSTLYLAEYQSHLVQSFSISGSISTFAGTGSSGYNGDNIPATQASLSLPFGLAIDGSGNVFIGDPYSGRVREVISNQPPNPCNVSGNICTVAGNGTKTYSGDNGLAVQAGLNAAGGSIYVDPSNNLYIADFINSGVIRKVNSNGVIQRIAGTGASYSGEAGDGGPALNAIFGGVQGFYLASNQSLLFIDYPGATRSISSTGVISTLVPGGQSIYEPSGFTGNSTNYYIAELDNCAIISVAASGSFTQISANGNGSTAENIPLSQTEACPDAIAVDSQGNIFYSDANLNTVRKFNATSGLVTTVAGSGSYGYSGDGGPARSASMTPTGLAVDGNGNIFIADGKANVVRMVRASNGSITTVAGTGIAGFTGDGGLATQAELNTTGGYQLVPLNIALDSTGNLYISDSNNGRVRRVAAPAVAAGSGGGTTTPPVKSPPGSGCRNSRVCTQ